MGPFDIFVIVVVVAAFLAVVGCGIYKRVTGKGGRSCDCDCSRCGGCCKSSTPKNSE